MAQKKAKSEGMEDLFARLGSVLEDETKPKAKRTATVRQQFKKYELALDDRAFRLIRDLYSKYESCELLTRGRFRYPCAFLPIHTTSQQDDVECILEKPLGEAPDGDLIGRGYRKYRELLVHSANLEATREEEKPYNGTTFAMSHIQRHDGMVKISCYPCEYYDAIDTCDFLKFELAKAWHDYGHKIQNPEQLLTYLPERAELHRLLKESGETPLLSGRYRKAAIAVSTLICYLDKDTHNCCLYHRSPQKVLVDRGGLHVRPAGMFEPHECSIGHEPFSIRETVIRECVEEMFLKDHEDARQLSSGPDPRWYYKTEIEVADQIDNSLEHGDYSLHLTSIVVNLLNLRTEVCTLLLCKTRSWAKVWMPRMTRSWEYAELGDIPDDTNMGLCVALQADEEEVLKEKRLEPTNMVVPGAAAFWLGRKLLQERPALLHREKKMRGLRPTTEKVPAEVYVLLKERNDKKFRKGYHPLADAKKKRIGCDIVVWEIEPDRFVGIAEADRCRRHRFGRAATTFGMLWLALDNVGGSFLVSDIDNVRPKGHDKTEPSTKQRYVEDFKKFLGDMHRQLIKPGRPSERVVPAKDLSICWVRAHEDPLTSELLYGLESHKPLQEK